MQKAQGALEYLIIIAAILVIAGVVVLLISGSAGGEKESFLINSCREAASECKITKIANPNDPCNMCIEACSDPTTGEEVFEGAIDCCQLGKPQHIYQGATKCEAPVCGNEIKEEGETCDSDSKDCTEFGNYESGPAPCKDDCSGYDTSECAVPPSPPECGNGVIEGDEVCEIGGSMDCSELDPMYASGVATCKTDCSGYDTSVCTTSPNQLPTALFTPRSKQAADPPLTVNFDASASSDPDGTIVSWSWDFGDGSTGNGVTASHIYLTKGQYTVKLTVTDNEGGTGSLLGTMSIGRPDLYVDYVEFRDPGNNKVTEVEEGTCTLDHKCKIVSKIINSGDISANYKVYLYIDGSTSVHSYKSSFLDPGGVEILDFKYPSYQADPPLSIGTHMFKVRVEQNDPLGWPTEADTANNENYVIIAVVEAPVENHPPTLSNGDVSPSSGTTTTTFTYTVTYTDADNDNPNTKDVIIDGQSHTMSKQTPSDNDFIDGVVYQYITKLSRGSHNYYFSFSDTHGASARYPSSGTRSGPVVTERQYENRLVYLGKLKADDVSGDISEKDFGTKVTPFAIRNWAIGNWQRYLQLFIGIDDGKTHSRSRYGPDDPPNKLYVESDSGTSSDSYVKRCTGSDLDIGERARPSSDLVDPSKNILIGQGDGEVLLAHYKNDWSCSYGVETRYLKTISGSRIDVGAKAAPEAAPNWPEGERLLVGGEDGKIRKYGYVYSEDGFPVIYENMGYLQWYYDSDFISARDVVVRFVIPDHDIKNFLKKDTPTIIVGNTYGTIANYEITKYGKVQDGEIRKVKYYIPTYGIWQAIDDMNLEYTSPALVDWEGDGDLDLLVGEINGYVYFFETQTFAI